MGWCLIGDLKRAGLLCCSRRVRHCMTAFSSMSDALLGGACSAWPLESQERAGNSQPSNLSGTGLEWVRIFTVLQTFVWCVRAAGGAPERRLRLHGLWLQLEAR